LKDLVLGTVEIKQNDKKKKKRLIVGIAIVVLSVILPFVVPVNLVVPIGGLCILTLVSSMLYSTPFFVRVITRLFERLYYRLFGNEGFIAVKNIKNNDNINQNVSLLIISISTLLLVSILSTTLQELVTNSFLGSNYQITTQGTGVDNSFVKRINGLKSVELTYPSYQTSNVEIKNSKEKFRSVEGVNGVGVLEFFDIPLKEGKVEPLLEMLQSERNILIADAMMLKLEAKVGDLIILNTKKGDKPYKIVGVMALSRSDAIIGNRFIKSDFELSNYGFVAVKSKDPEKAVLDIKDLYGGKNNFTSTIPELVNRVKSVFGVLFGILKGFSVVLLVIGIFGVMNNLIINFIQQRRAIAMFRSVGMSKIQLRKIAFIEAVTAGVIGGVLGISTTLLELVLVSKVLKNLFGVVPIEYPPLLFIGAFAIGIIVTLIGSIGPGIKGQKLKIIEAIKFQ
jgi:putative ABC transport system permease protein